MKRYGFTLAEVLITFAIIGVVAAITIPTMIANYQKQQYVTQLKQVYSQIGQALKLMMVDEGINKVSDTDMLTSSTDEIDADTLQRAGGFLNKYFKVIKDCGTQNKNPCFPEVNNSVDGADNISTGMTGASYCVIIESGTSICVKPATQPIPGFFTIDTNGLKTPNTDGRDIFGFGFYYDGSLDQGTPGQRKDAQWAALKRKDRFENYCDVGRGVNAYGIGCFEKILNDGWKMDY